MIEQSVYLSKLRRQSKTKLSKNIAIIDRHQQKRPIVVARGI
jgi:hypothetical protein